MIIRKVWKAKKKNQLYVTIPKNEGIKEGDYIKIEKLENGKEKTQENDR